MINDSLGGKVYLLINCASGSIACSSRPTITSSSGSHSLNEFTGHVADDWLEGTLTGFFLSELHYSAVVILSPTKPTRIRAMQRNLMGCADSLKNTIPRTTTPTVPILFSMI